VGTTTIALNLAVALARRGARTVLVDAAPSGNAAILCRLEPQYTLADVLSGAKSVDEAVYPGPGNVRLLAGLRELERLTDYSLADVDRMMDELGDLTPKADVVVLETGNSPNRTAQRFWQKADALLLLTTPEAAAIMDIYAAIKIQAPRDRGARCLLVNRSPSVEVAEEIHQRLDHACHRFLGIRLTSAGQVPLDERVAAAAAAGEPFVATSPSCPASRHVGRLAQAMLATTAAKAA
jgi:flagellar biosynthesis protein FlhG